MKLGPAVRRARAEVTMSRVAGVSMREVTGDPNECPGIGARALRAPKYVFCCKAAAAIALGERNPRFLTGLPPGRCLTG